ncbi:MAG: Uma2 family endonuclease [Acidobacteria bacterium]|nr:Uma2 family endonuclease [Acidobacteriota bacterium]
MALMQDVQPRFGYSDLLAMPEDGRRYEIHGGELVVVAAPLARHQIAAFEVATVLNDYGHRSGGRTVIAPFDIVFDEYDVAQPDVVFFRAERSHLVRPDVVTRSAPDIAVEVLSPSTAAVDRGRKMEMFARYGVPEYWIVDPVRLEIEVHVLENGAYRCAQVATRGDTVRSILLPDLTFAAARVFTFA